MRVLVLLLGISLFVPGSSFAQEKKTAKKTQKKKSEPKQDWGRFNSSSKKDLDKLEKEKAAKKAQK